jgi:hypothetical protein
MTEIDDLEALPLGTSVVLAHSPEPMMAITDTRTDGTSIYHTVTWRDEAGRSRAAEYERGDLVHVDADAPTQVFATTAMMAGRR